jgi:hypothetical protein
MLIVSLAAFEGELTSRSQAKRIVARFESFEEVELDFNCVDHIGQAFADELARVWPLSHPNTRMNITNAGESIVKMLLIRKLLQLQPSYSQEYRNSVDW